MDYKVGQIIDAYRFDEHGHFFQVSGAQVVKKKDGTVGPALPPDCVLFAPEGKDGFWYVISDDRTKWDAVKKPTTAVECVGMFIEHEDQCDYAHECRQLFEDLCAASGGTYQVVRDEDLTLTVEAVPEPTSEEVAANEAEQELRDFDSHLQDIKDRMVIAQLSGNTELVTQLQQEYSELMAV